jgi:hypothetical protein
MLCGSGREELAESNVRDKREQKRRSKVYMSQSLNGRHEDLGMMKLPSWFTKSSIIRYEMVGFMNARQSLELAMEWWLQSNHFRELKICFGMIQKSNENHG